MHRFWSKVNKHGPRVGRLGRCWVWTANRDRKGYGYFWFEGHQARAPRVAWQLVRGRIPAGLSVLHRCDNPPCVRLSHLFLGTQADNQRDMAAKGRWRNQEVDKEYCPRNHSLADAYIYRTRSGGLRRVCRSCAIRGRRAA